jgi:16S rRNA (cytidine1402-2'-O)-methyltransferase
VSIDASSILQAAALAAGGQQYPAGALYVVATPIGNLADVTLRAIHVLALVDAVACEDTRVTGALLRHLGLDKPMLAVHEHNEREAARRVLERLARGERVAYVSDAGTPALSDPGAALVDAARSAGYRTVPLPGPSAALAALSVAGTPTHRGFRFAGFVGARARERAADVAGLARDTAAQIVFEAPHRVEALAAALALACPQRPLTLCRELTKQFETIVTRTAAELPAWLAQEAHRERGEFVLVLHEQAPAPAGAGADDAAQHALRLLLRELPLKQAVALAAELTGAPRNALYDAALALRDEGP